MSDGPDEKGNWAMLAPQVPDRAPSVESVEDGTEGGYTASPAGDHPVFSQWTHYNPTLVEALAAHGAVPEQEVVDHLSALFSEATTDSRVPPLERQAEAVRRYVEEYVAVG
jgi:hypothetical protein